MSPGMGKRVSVFNALLPFLGRRDSVKGDSLSTGRAWDSSSKRQQGGEEWAQGDWEGLLSPHHITPSP